MASKWIHHVTEGIKKHGTEGVCSGGNFGGPSCPSGSHRYNLAVTFKKMAKKHRHLDGLGHAET